MTVLTISSADATPHPRATVDRARAVLATMSVLVFVLLVSVIAILFWPFTPLEAVQPFKLYTPVVHAGEPLIYEADYVAHTDQVFDVEWQLVDVKTPDLYSLLPLRGKFHPGKGEHHILRTVMIPSDTPPGRYYLRVKDSVRVIHKIRPTDVVWFNTDVFTVLPRGPML